MDAGALGGIIGISVMVGLVLSWKCIDTYKERKRKKQLLKKEGSRQLLSTPTSLKEEKRPILVIKRQWKMKDLKLPKSYVLHNLSIRKL